MLRALVINVDVSPRLVGFSCRPGEGTATVSGDTA